MTVEWNGLLEGCKRGDRNAENALFSALRVRLLTVAQFRLQKAPMALLEDMVQGTLELVVKRIASIDSNPHLFALQVLYNKIGDHLRSQSRHAVESLSATDASEEDPAGGALDTVIADPESAGFEAQVEVTDQLDRIRRAVRKLSPLCQALFVALLEYRTIGEVWDLAVQQNPKLSRSAFDKRLFDCRRQLRARVGTL